MKYVFRQASYFLVKLPSLRLSQCLKYCELRAVIQRFAFNGIRFSFNSPDLYSKTQALNAPERFANFNEAIGSLCEYKKFKYQRLIS